jgi:hypothetical protein
MSAMSNVSGQRSHSWLRPLIYGYGSVLLLIGLATLALGGVEHWTAFIPLALGVIVVLAAIGARRGGMSDIAAAAIAAALGILALAGTLSALPLLPQALLAPPESAQAPAVLARAATAGATLGAMVLAPILWVLANRRPVA